MLDPSVWDREIVRNRLSEAAETLKRCSGGRNIKPSGFRSWPVEVRRGIRRISARLHSSLNFKV